jgi:hypothetical protein
MNEYAVQPDRILYRPDGGCAPLVKPGGYGKPPIIGIGKGNPAPNPGVGGATPTLSRPPGGPGAAPRWLVSGPLG